MGVMAIRTEGLSKRYGSVHAIEDLDLEVAEGEVVGYLGPNGAGKTTTIRLLLGLIRPSAGRAEIFGLDCQRQVVEAHRRLAYVAGEASLWPSLTGAETLHLLGRVQGRVDDTYRDELIGRFDLDPSKKVRACSKGNRQKLILIAALMTRPELLVLDEPTSGLDPLMEQAFRHCVHEARARPDDLLVFAHPERGRGAVRPDRDPARRPAGGDGDAGGDAPPLGSHDRGDIRGSSPRHLPGPGRVLCRGCRTSSAMPRPRNDRASPEGVGSFGRAGVVEPGTVTRGALPRPVRRKQRERRHAGSCKLNWPSGVRHRRAGGPPRWSHARRRTRPSVPACCGGTYSVPTWRLRHSPTPRATRPSRSELA